MINSLLLMKYSNQGIILVVKKELFFFFFFKSRNKMHNKLMHLNHPKTIPLSPCSVEKNIFHETGPCAKMVGDHCPIAPKTGPYIQ